MTSRPAVRPRRLLLATALLGATAATAGLASASAGDAARQAAHAYLAQHASAGTGEGARLTAARAAQTSTPAARCAPGDRAETGRDGRVPLADYASGRAAKGYACNAVDVGHEGNSGGFRVARYVDRSGHECAYYDSTLLFPSDVAGKGNVPGTYVLDMKDPRSPVRTAVLSSPAMMTPHESLRLNARRGLLVSNAGSATTQAGFVDTWDVSADCLHPVFRSSLPLAVAGHEGGFSPDGRTYWATTTQTLGLTAIDLTNPSVPVLLGRFPYAVHGLNLSADGRRAYLADVYVGPTSSFVQATTQGGGGMRVLDVSQVQDRVPNPQVKEVGYVTWPEVTIPQNTIPATIRGHKYLFEFDEYSTNVFQYSADQNVGGVHVIDLADDRHPRLVNRIRLAVWNTAARADQQADPGAATVGQGYAAHYCSTPREVDPGLLACSTIASGLRVFDVRDPLHVREVAYVNHPETAGPKGAYAMSAPAWVPARKEIWYTDGNTGFWAVRLTHGAWKQ